MTVQIRQPTRYGLESWGGRELRRYGQAPVYWMAVDLGLTRALRTIAERSLSVELDRRGLDWPQWEIAESMIEQAVELMRLHDSKPSEAAEIVAAQTLEEGGWEG